MVCGVSVWSVYVWCLCSVVCVCVCNVVCMVHICVVFMWSVYVVWCVCSVYSVCSVQCGVHVSMCVEVEGNFEELVLSSSMMALGIDSGDQVRW